MTRLIVKNIVLIGVLVAWYMLDVSYFRGNGGPFFITLFLIVLVDLCFENFRK